LSPEYNLAVPVRASVPVCFADVDPAGIVYYPTFVHYLHLAMEEIFTAELGCPYSAYVAEHGMGFATVRLEVDFRGPLRYGDRAEIEVWVVRVGESSVEWRDFVYRNEDPDPVAEARIVTANVDMAALERREIPGWLRERLAGLARPAPSG